MDSTYRRRGRPRHNRSKIDKGTLELQQKRKLLLRSSQNESSFLAESLLGILYAHNVISEPLYEAGKFFGELGYQYEPCLSHAFRWRVNVLSSLKGRDLGKEKAQSDIQDEKLTRAWRKALMALKQAGNQSYKMVLTVVFYDRDLYTDHFPCSI